MGCLSDGKMKIIYRYLKFKNNEIKYVTNTHKEKKYSEGYNNKNMSTNMISTHAIIVISVPYFGFL